jgi:hypothetical protein
MSASQYGEQSVFDICTAESSCILLMIVCDSLTLRVKFHPHPSVLHRRVARYAFALHIGHVFKDACLWAP